MIINGAEKRRSASRSLETSFCSGGKNADSTHNKRMQAIGEEYLRPGDLGQLSKGLPERCCGERWPEVRARGRQRG